MIQKPFRGVQLNRTHPLAKGLVGCWLFNEATGETVFDSSGNDNHGTLKNGVAWGSGGLEFDGVDDYVDCGNGSSLDITEAITIGAIVRITDNTIPSQEIVDKRLGDSTSNYFVRIANGYVSFYFYNGGWRSLVDTTTRLSVDVDHQIVITYDKQYIRLYVDGIEVITTAQTLSLIPDTSNLLIGKHGHASSGFLDGSIDSVRIYNRALSAEEVAWSYREPYAMFEPAFNPALLYSVVPPVGAIMNQFQGANIGADLYNGVFA